MQVSSSLICSTCGGKGEVDCVKCTGSGTLPTKCDECKGKGKLTIDNRVVECDICNGRGIIETKCDECFGGGRLACDTCGGSGST